ncbi:putative GTP diphosphokinase [Nymphaea thermarum]|nr:putative GTP diphosphokinase [Nymphaea thermarum]
MVSATSISVLMECMSRCTLVNQDVSGRWECSALSCAWKAPRVLSGFLASTTQPHSSTFHSCRAETRNSKRHGRYTPWNCEIACIQGLGFLESVDSAFLGGFHKSCGISSACNGWRLYSTSSCSSDGSDAISPEILWEDLKQSISYLPPNELHLVKNALKLAFEAHDGQKRRSGEPFIIHPVEVARILGELELDWESIAAGLLHDTVEDTKVVTFERIEEEFGATVRHIVEGETKVSKLGKLQYNNATTSAQDVKADDLRQMFLAMTEEVHVVIVKLADRLHNMHTLSHMPQHKQSSIALETLQVFAPLAKLLGMYRIKSELENLSFTYTNAHEYAEIQRRISELCKEHSKELDEAKRILVQNIEKDQFLELMTVSVDVHSVCKDPYSIYKAILKSKGSIHEVNQIAQLRIVIKPKPCIGVGPLCAAQQICYHVLGLVHGIWAPIPRAMKDYIATPKPNGYQSLHTAVIPFLYESMFRLEVQIRTADMDLIAERGIAAHYSGREQGISTSRHNNISGRNMRTKAACLNNADIALRIGWLNAIPEWQEEFVGNMSSREFVDTVTRDLLGSRVFVFTPKGDIKNLPKGATVVDYAYQIHTEIGNKMVVAKVNGNLVSPAHVLVNAEVVEIITYNALSSKTAFQRHQQWLQHAKTRSARHKIMKAKQAALSAAEITAEAVNNFVADNKCSVEPINVIPDLSREEKSMWRKILMNVSGLSTRNSHENIHHVQGKLGTPKVNGKHNKNLQKMSLKINGDFLSQERGLSVLPQKHVPYYKEVLSGLETWRAGKVAFNPKYLFRLMFREVGASSRAAGEYPVPFSTKEPTQIKLAVRGRDQIQ